MSLGLTISFTVVVVLLVVAALGVLLDRTAEEHRSMPIGSRATA